MKVCLDPGHGGKANGAVFNGVAEKDITLLICLCLEKLLISRGYEVVLTRDLDYYVPLGKRTDIANEAEADILIAVHCNADPDDDAPGTPEAKGEEVWHYRHSIRGLQLAHSLMGPIDTVFPDHKGRGVKPTTSFYVLKNTHMPAALIEVGFIDNATEMEALSHPGAYLKIARLIAEGISIYERRM